MANLLFNPTSGMWINTDKPGGRVYFVADPGTTSVPSTYGVAAKGRTGSGIGASDTNAGVTPEQPLATIDGTSGALAHCTAGRGDTIVVLPGVITITAAITLSKTDITLTGYSNTGAKTRNPSVITCATNSVEMIAIEAANVTVENLTLTNTATTADVFLIDVGDVTASPDYILRNVFLDFSGGAATVNGISISGDTVSDNGRIEGCCLHDLDDVGITVADGNINTIIENCLIYDNIVASNTMLTGISAAADYTKIFDCIIMNSAAAAGASCINVTATAQAVLMVGNRVQAFGSGGHGILYAAAASGPCLDVHVGAGALAGSVDFTTAVTGISSVTGQVSAPGDGTISELPNPNVA